MKRLFSLALVLSLLALLCGCGSSGAPETQPLTEAPTQAPTEATEAPTETIPADQLSPEGYYMQVVKRGDTKTTYYREGGKKGKLMGTLEEYGDGSYRKEMLDADGKTVSLVQYAADGSGTEFVLEEGGVKWNRIVYEDGTAYEERRNAEDVLIYDKHERPAENYVIWNEYYDTGVHKSHYHYDPTLEIKQENDPEGYCLYLYEKSDTTEMECISDEDGTLIQYRTNETVYEDAATLSMIAKSYNFRNWKQ